jgi:anthraniloyl-CoA monooxygenase
LSQVPRALDETGMEDIVRQFAEATERAARAGFGMALVDMAHGYLLGSFLSPLSNRRTDQHGGPLGDRMRFPLRVFDAVRAAWPDDKPAGVILLATDWVPGGFDVDDAVVVARALKDHGCDLIMPAGGQTVARDNPNYGRFAMVPAADRIRNEVGIPTAVAGNITTNDEINTIIAAGRADLCVLDAPMAP